MSGPGHLRILTAIAASGLLLGLAGCGLATTPDPQPVVLGPAIVLAPPDPMAGAPSVGSCHRLTPDQVDRGIDARPAVPCTTTHTTVTYLVDTFPVGNARAKVDHVRRTCLDALPAAVGVAPDELAGLLLTWAWFEPNGDQHRQGANWFRCDVKVLPGAGAASDSLPGSGLPVVTGRVPNALRRCAVASDDATTFVSCDRDHTHRWVGSAEVPGNAYPDPAAWRSRARTECRPLVGDDTFVFTYPSAADWKQGRRGLSCFRGA